MITYEQSQEILKSVARTQVGEASEIVPLAECAGRVLAEDLRARENNPPFDNSAMDGFAVNASESFRRTEATQGGIPVQGLIGAGDLPLASPFCGEAVEIMTGAPLPHAYFDCVVKIEDVDVTWDSHGQKVIRFKTKPQSGSNIRRAGEDTRRGDLLLTKNTRIQHHHLLALATQGIAEVAVKKKLRLGILSTGRELVTYSCQELHPGQIRNSTGIFLEASLAEPQYAVKSYGIVADSAEEYIKTIEMMFTDEVDIVIGTGAVSMGVFDFVKPALERIGATVHFHKCAIRPGKPILFASLCYAGKTRFIFGLPGNPASTFMGLSFFIKPFLRELLGLNPEKPMLAALAGDVTKPEGLHCFFKAELCFAGTEALVRASEGQGSNMVHPFLKSNAWIILPAEGAHLKQGSLVEVLNYEGS